MAELKTGRTEADVRAFLDHIPDERRRCDADVICALMERVSGTAPKMWGPSIVGFGTYRYTYASGHSGEAPLASFAIRGKDLVVYLSCEEDQQRPLLAKLGKHKIGKACLHIRQLADIDLAVLEELVVGSISEVKQRFG